MNNLRVTVLYFAVVFLWVAGLRVVAAPLADRGDDVGLNIIQTSSAQFPNGVVMQGIHSGKVRLVVSIDAEGRLVDCLVVAYTNKAFVASAVNAVKEWKYEPAKVRGRPRASRADLNFDFKADLVVAVQNAEFNFLHDMLGTLNAFEPSQLKDLDHIPVPIHVVTPVIPDGVLAQGEMRNVTVDFYIDQEGKVRVPSVARDLVDDHLAAIAVEAVEQWRFEPPMRKGSAVLVLARQDFRFVAKPTR